MTTFCFNIVRVSFASAAGHDRGDPFGYAALEFLRSAPPSCRISRESTLARSVAIVFPRLYDPPGRFIFVGATINLS